MTLKNKDLDIYFHMRNHYKKLKTAKSTFNPSPSQAVAKRAFCSSPHCNTAQKTKKFEVMHYSNLLHIPYYDVPKNHICEHSVDRTSDTALLPRPRTRRNPNRSPEDTIDRRYRSQSVGGIPRKTKTIKKACGYSSRHYNTGQESQIELCDYEHQQAYHKRKKKNSHRGISSMSCSTNTAIEDESDADEGSKRSFGKKSSGDSKNASSVEEHEYLQFLLRVTEDIIINNYIQNEDIERVFKQHIEMNKHVLDKRKMEQHIACLAVELNISEAKTNQKESLEHSSSYTNLLCLNTTCQCEHPKHVLGDFFTPLVEHNKDYKENLDDIIYYRHSLGRVTECTEPSNSSATLTNKISNANFISFGNAEHSMIETKSELLVTSNENIVKELNIRDTLSDIAITDKSSPEDSLKDIPKNTGKTFITERIEDNKTTESCPQEKPTKVDRSTETSEGNCQKLDVKVQVNLPRQKVTEQSVQTSPRLIAEKADAVNKSTQSTSIVSNKKCDTKDLSEYVLLNRVQKTDFSVAQTDIPDEEPPLTNRTELEGSLNSFLELKLLGDDYDLTPERDTSEKYHFLMTDAATSMGPIQMLSTEEENLLVGDVYDINEQSILQGIPKNSYSYLLRNNLNFEEDISSAEDVHGSEESPRWITMDKNNSRYPRKLNFSSILTKVNTCTSTSSTSVGT